MKYLRFGESISADYCKDKPVIQTNESYPQHHDQIRSFEIMDINKNMDRPFLTADHA